MADVTIEALNRARDEIVEALAAFGAEFPVPPPLPKPEPPKRPLPNRRPVPPRSDSRVNPIVDTDVHLRKGAVKMLEVLARHLEFRVTRAQLGTLAGFAPKGGTFGQYLGDLKRAGLLVEQSGILGATEAGFEYLGELPQAPQTTEEILDQWRGALRAGERLMLDVLVEAYPESLTRAELAERTEFEVTGGTFGQYLGTLRRNGLAEVIGQDVTASETLFIAA